MIGFCNEFCSYWPIGCVKGKADHRYTILFRNVPNFPPQKKLGIQMSIDTNQISHQSSFEFPVARTKVTDLAKQIELAYDQLGHRGLATIYCRTEGSKITLGGETPTFYLKQVAQTIAAKVLGVGSFHNKITVADKS